jgi:hypothetical protein
LEYFQNLEATSLSRGGLPGLSVEYLEVGTCDECVIAAILQGQHPVVIGWIAPNPAYGALVLRDAAVEDYQ